MIKFIQIAATAETDDLYGSLYGLDMQGRIWQRVLTGSKGEWVLIPQPIEEKPEISDSSKK